MLKNIKYHDLPRPLHLLFIPRVNASARQFLLWTGFSFLLAAVFLYVLEQNLHLLADESATPTRPVQLALITLCSVVTLVIFAGWAAAVAPDAVTVLHQMREPYARRDDAAAASDFLAEFHRRRPGPATPGETHRLTLKIMHAFDMTEQTAARLVAASLPPHRAPAPAQGRTAGG